MRFRHMYPISHATLGPALIHCQSVQFTQNIVLDNAHGHVQVSHVVK